MLEERYGPHIYPAESSLLGQLTFAILAAENPVTNARKALRILEEEYVDWNELRVSSIREIEDTLRRARIEPAGELSEVIKGTLECTFRELCRVDLDMLRTAGAEKARKFVQKLDMLKPYQQHYVLSAAGFEGAPPLDPATERIGERLGVFRPEDQPAARLAALEAAIDRSSALRFHHLMVEHGKKLCTIEAPRCARCLVQTECAYYKAEEARRRHEAKVREKDGRVRAAVKRRRTAPSKGKLAGFGKDGISWAAGRPSEARGGFDAKSRQQATATKRPPPKAIEPTRARGETSRSRAAEEEDE